MRMIRERESVLTKKREREREREKKWKEKVKKKDKKRVTLHLERREERERSRKWEERKENDRIIEIISPTPTSLQSAQIGPIWRETMEFKYIYIYIYKEKEREKRKVEPTCSTSYDPKLYFCPNLSSIFYIHVDIKVKNIYFSFDFLCLCKQKEKEVYYSLFFSHLLISEHTWENCSFFLSFAHFFSFYLSSFATKQKLRDESD